MSPALKPRDWSECEDCSTATWCEHFKLCLSETSPQTHPLPANPLTPDTPGRLTREQMIGSVKWLLNFAGQFPHRERVDVGTLANAIERELTPVLAALAAEGETPPVEGRTWHAPLWGSGLALPPEEDDDLPADVRRELHECARHNGRISYWYLCHLWRRGRRVGRDAAPSGETPPPAPSDLVALVLKWQESRLNYWGWGEGDDVKALCKIHEADATALDLWKPGAPVAGEGETP
jgi:hypothetical protein